MFCQEATRHIHPMHTWQVPNMSAPQAHACLHLFLTAAICDVGEVCCITKPDGRYGPGQPPATGIHVQVPNEQQTAQHPFPYVLSVRHHSRSLHTHQDD